MKLLGLAAWLLATNVGGWTVPRHTSRIRQWQHVAQTPVARLYNTPDPFLESETKSTSVKGEVAVAPNGEVDTEPEAETDAAVESNHDVAMAEETTVNGDAQEEEISEPVIQEKTSTSVVAEVDEAQLSTDEKYMRMAIQMAQSA